MNLLPDTDKKKMSLEYHWRLAETACVMGVVLVLISGVLLLPSLMHVVFETRSVEAALVSHQNERAFLEKDLETQAVVRSVQNKLKVLRDEDVPQEFFPLISAVLEKRVAGTKLGSFMFERLSSVPDARARIILGGTALTRAHLLRLVASLESEPRFVRVESPIENLVPSRDIPFTVNVYVK